MLTLEPGAGESIQRTAQDAILMATDGNESVYFKFNDVSITVRPGDTTDAILRQWESETQQQMAEYQASPQYATDQAMREGAREKAQAAVTMLSACLSACIKGGDRAVVSWVGQFAGPSDYRGVEFDRAGIVRKLKAAGYVNEEYVGDPEVPTDQAKMARWIIGQAISGLVLGMSPHPILAQFADRYSNLAP